MVWGGVVQRLQEESYGTFPAFGGLSAACLLLAQEEQPGYAGASGAGDA